MNWLWRITAFWVCAWCGTMQVGCRSAREIRDPDFVPLIDQAESAWDGPAVVEVEAEPVVEFAGPQSVEALVRLAVAQNPEIRAARKRVDAMAMRVPQAAALQDPMLNLTIPLDQVQTAAGQQELTLAASQKLPWRVKRDFRAAKAAADVEVARAELAAAEFDVVEQVRRVAYELMFLDDAMSLTEEDRARLLNIRQSVQDRFRTGKALEADVLRVQQEVLELDAELLRLRQQGVAARAKLARLMHVSPDTTLSVQSESNARDIPRDLQRLYEQAVAARPELQAQLSAVQRDKHSAELARLEYLPDPTWSATWIDTSHAGLSPIANGQDAFLIGVGINLPVYRSRLDAQVREAEAQAVASARKYDSLKDQTQEQVKELFERALNQQELLELFESDIVTTAERTRRLSIPAYEVDKINIQQLLENWRRLLRVEIAQRRLKSDLLQTIASLERLVGGELQSASPPEAIDTPAPLDGADPPLPATPE